ncbi:PREDICTED: protein phosphatase 1 regulatory subunit 32 isoform X3 [Myotis brandtii]|uniref:protein phosphatase 1 regulatory subunit 32 isoform X3 n=1 Tax=Myotis brandtii TaxID=109478 RepID=UPI0007041840|nr:PREDICTED: protein phosphatase 1 regulatory subunit 32 isoform X3 [Myotis brandtii]
MSGYEGAMVAPLSSPRPSPVPRPTPSPGSPASLPRLRAHTTMLTIAVTPTSVIITPVFLPVFVVATIPIITITSGYPPTHSCIHSTTVLAISSMADGDKCWGDYNRDEAGGEAEVKGLPLQIRSEKVAMETLDKDVREVRKVHFDTQDYGPQAITGLEPKHVPLLQQQNKGSVEWENARHGPRFMTSEYNSKYLKEPSTQPDLLQKKSIGAKEESGFTEASAKNPIAFQAPSQALPGDPGDELLPQVARGSERETGFSRVNERILGSRVPPPSPERGSMTHWQFQHPQRVQQTNVSLLGRETVGNKEPTGYSLNNASYVRSPYEPGLDNPYLTSYSQGYFENIPKGLDREGWTGGGLQPQKPGGYALNQPVTRMEAIPTPTESLRHLHPHVGRTLISTDPFYRPPPHCGRFNTPH